MKTSSLAPFVIAMTLSISSEGWTAEIHANGKQAREFKWSPQAVQDQVGRTFPDATISIYHKEKMDGDLVYVIHLKDAKGVEHKLILSKDGVINKDEVK